MFENTETPILGDHPLLGPQTSLFFFGSKKFMEIKLTYHTIHPFKLYNILGFLVYSQSCATITTINFRIVSLFSKEIQLPLTTVLPPHRPPSLHSSLAEATTNGLSASIYVPVLGISYKWNHIIYMPFCDWLLLFSIIFSRLSHTVARITTSFFFMAK